MPQVSRRVLSKEVEGKVIETFLEAISQLKRKEDILLFMEDLLTPVERTMLVKRMAIAVLLLKGWSYASINNFLKVSDETIARVSIVLKNKRGYKLVANKLSQTQAVKEFWQDLQRTVYRFSSPSNVFIQEGLIKNKFGHKNKTIL